MQIDGMQTELLSA